MIGRARELLGELVDAARLARALPELVTKSAELELRIMRLERDRDTLADDCARANVIASELYLAPPADSEVPDA